MVWVIIFKAFRGPHMLQEGGKKTNFGLCYVRNYANILRAATKEQK